MRIIAILIIVFTANFVTAQEIWKSYSPQNALTEFTVKSPGELSYQRDSIDNAAGTIVSEVFYYKNDDRTYMITHIQYPSDFFPKEEKTEIVDDLIEHSVQSSKERLLGRMIYLTDIDDSRFNGKNYRIRYNADKQTLKARIFFYQGSLYNIQVVSPVSQSTNKDIDRFINSFRLK